MLDTIDAATGGSVFTPFSKEVPAWLDLWATGRYDFKLGEEEFWSLTLREFNAISIKCRDNEQRVNYRYALVCAVIANTVRDPKRKSAPFRPEDFMPKSDVRIQTPKQMLEAVKLANAAFGGSVKEL